MPEVTFRDVDPSDENDILYLYAALDQRLQNPNENISHKRMPTVDEHRAFVQSEPYAHWWILRTSPYDHAPEGHKVGTLYLTRNNEIGIWIAKHRRRLGYASAALNWLITYSEIPGPFYAHINPLNRSSQGFFKAFNFDLLQCTYKCDKPATQTKNNGSVLVRL